MTIVFYVQFRLSELNYSDLTELLSRWHLKHVKIISWNSWWSFPSWCPVTTKVVHFSGKTVLIQFWLGLSFIQGDFLSDWYRYLGNKKTYKKNVPGNLEKNLNQTLNHTFYSQTTLTNNFVMQTYGFCDL